VLDLPFAPAAKVEHEERSADRAEAAAADGEHEEPPAAAASIDGEGIVAMAEGALAVVVGIKATSLGLALEEPQASELATFSDGERAALRMLAPLAAPYMQSASDRYPVVGAALFAVVFAVAVGSRMRKVGELAPPKEQDDEATDETVSSARAAREHRERWGRAAENVPYGTPLRDTGKFPSRRR